MEKKRRGGRRTWVMGIIIELQDLIRKHGSRIPTVSKKKKNPGLKQTIPQLTDRQMMRYQIVVHVYKHRRMHTTTWPCQR